MFCSQPPFAVSGCAMNLRQCVCFGASINCNTGQVACLEVYECSLSELLLSFQFATCRCFLFPAWGMLWETLPSQLLHVLPRTYSMCFSSIVCVCVLIFVIFFLLHAEGVTTNTLLRMETGLLYTRVDTGSSLLCFYREASRLKPGMCDSANLSSWVPWCPVSPGETWQLPFVNDSLYMYLELFRY